MPDDYAALDTPQDLTEERLPHCEDLGGVAGSGKTYLMHQRVAEDASYGVLCSTTGISAVNLGATTVHSLLRFFDTASARDWYLSGGMVRILHSLARTHRRLIIDEKSMLDGDLLDILYRAVSEANRFPDVPAPMGITLVGDFAQLPPVKAKWAFEADCWPMFAEHSEVLRTQWRQVAGDPFYVALNMVRRGHGGEAAGVLAAAGAQWHTALDTEFDGTTILPRNDMVSRYNALALARLPGQVWRATSRRWGQQRSEWGENRRTHEWGVPPALELKPNAYVMILANQPDGNGGFEYVNGDCGHVVGYEHGAFIVHLVRTDASVEVPPIVRAVDTMDRPDGWQGRTVAKDEDVGGYLPELHYRGKARRYVLGQVEYVPLRLAYASTVHKSQGLTLDRAQVDFRDRFFASPSMLYVAISRCRTLGGLRLVGGRDRFEKQCNFDRKIERWL